MLPIELAVQLGHLFQTGELYQDMRAAEKKYHESAILRMLISEFVSVQNKIKKDSKQLFSDEFRDQHSEKWLEEGEKNQPALEYIAALADVIRNHECTREYTRARGEYSDTINQAICLVFLCAFYPEPGLSEGGLELCSKMLYTLMCENMEEEADGSVFELIYGSGYKEWCECMADAVPNPQFFNGERQKSNTVGEGKKDAEIVALAKKLGKALKESDAFKKYSAAKEEYQTNEDVKKYEEEIQVLEERIEHYEELMFVHAELRRAKKKLQELEDKLDTLPCVKALEESYDEYEELFKRVMMILFLSADGYDPEVVVADGKDSSSAHLMYGSPVRDEESNTRWIYLSPQYNTVLLTAWFIREVLESRELESESENED